MEPSEQSIAGLSIGGGWAGLTAAAQMPLAGRCVRVLDKGRGEGGRLASRGIGEASFDHGAQFIKHCKPLPA